MGLLIDMIAVGEGDSFLLTLDGPYGERYILIDGGLPEAGQKVLNYVTKWAPTGLSLVIATHIDNDHIGGLATVLEHATFAPGAEFALNVPPAIKEHWTPARGTLEKYRGVTRFRGLIEAVDAVKTLSAIANRKGLVVSDALEGRWWSYGEVVLNVLNPTIGRLEAAWEESDLDRYIQGGWAPELVSAVESVAEAPSTSAENDSSIVIEITNGAVPCALMASDAGAAVLKEVTHGKAYEFLKVPHHGSKTGLDEGLVRQLRPSTAFIPVGENQNGHPCIEILDLLKDNGATTYCAGKTKDCRKLCTYPGGNIYHAIGRAGRPGSPVADSSKCRNNVRA
ncbi:MAG: MBL fold metallo-hydrolase [Acidobacteriia bacterium]|nr:MBL fold metallo-hydrolase [Terriglobia bacterium]